MVLKKSRGKSSLLLNAVALAPSQLTSRRPVGCWPGIAPLAGSPISVRKSATFAAMSPVAVMTVACGSGDGCSGASEFVQPMSVAATKALTMAMAVRDIVGLLLVVG